MIIKKYRLFPFITNKGSFKTMNEARQFVQFYYNAPFIYTVNDEQVLSIDDVLSINTGYWTKVKPNITYELKYNHNGVPEEVIELPDDISLSKVKDIYGLICAKAVEKYRIKKADPCINKMLMDIIKDLKDVVTFYADKKHIVRDNNGITVFVETGKFARNVLDTIKDKLGEFPAR